MPLSDHVSLTITQDSVGVSRAGFGTILMLSASTEAQAWVERVRTYSSLGEVLEDFPSTSGPEYRAAAAIFSQSPHPEQIKIGRSALPPTQKYTLTPVVRNSHTYSLTLSGDGATTTTVTFASDASATAAEIVTGLIAAVNAVVGKNFTASGTTTLVITANAAGEWFSVEATDVADWTTTGQDHVDPGVATDLAAIALEDSDWYALHTGYNSKAYVGAAAAWIETQKKIYVFDTNDVSCISVAVGSADDVLEDIFDLAYARTMGAYHPSPAAMMSAAWMGRVLPIDPGGVTWKFKTLAGVDVVSLTGTHRSNLLARKANSYQRVSGVNITWEGTSADGDFLDVRRDLDWLDDDMSAAVFGALAGADKIPYTDDGIAIIEAEVRGSLDRAVSRGIIAEGYVVTVPRAANVSSADKAARILPDVRFSATLAGSIHKVEITGVVSV